jgi:hypothetical protein
MPYELPGVARGQPKPQDTTVAFPFSRGATERAWNLHLSSAAAGDISNSCRYNESGDKCLHCCTLPRGALTAACGAPTPLQASGPSSPRSSVQMAAAMAGTTTAAARACSGSAAGRHPRRLAAAACVCVPHRWLSYSRRIRSKARAARVVRVRPTPRPAVVDLRWMAKTEGGSPSGWESV